MEFAKQSERWEDEQLQTLELALGFPPGTITAADIEYLIRRSYADYDDSEDDDLCFSVQSCQIGGGDQEVPQPYESRGSRKSSKRSSSSSRSKADSGRSASSSSQKTTSRTTQKAEKSRSGGNHHRRK